MPDGFIQLRRFKDFEKSSGRRTILRHFADAVTNLRGTGRQFFFANAVSALFSSERHRAAPGRTSVGDRTDIGQQPDGARTDIVLTLSFRPVTEPGSRTIYAIISVQPFEWNRR